MMRSQTFILGFFISHLAFAVCNQLQLDPNLPKTKFFHNNSHEMSWFKSHHSASDVITVTNKDAAINAKFSYSPMHTDLEDENIEIWIDTCGQKLVLLDTAKTDTDGRVMITLPSARLPSSGTYKIWMRVTGDNTSTSFTLKILEPQTHLAIFDIDGTLTYGELEPGVRPGAKDTTLFLKNSGLEIVYLSGRHYFLTRMTRNLLSEHEVAEGSLVVGQSLSDIVPVDSYVGEFKAHYLKYLQELGLIIDRAYGDSKTDVYAYQQVKIPNSHIFILGKNGGYNGSQRLGEDLLQHLQDLLNGR